MTEFIAKSKWVSSELSDRLQRGASKVEIQILEPDIDPFLRESWWDGSFVQHVAAVHTPLVNMGNITDDYSIDTKKGREIILDICNRAVRIADKVQRPVSVITHLSRNINQLRSDGDLGKLIDWLRHMCVTYPQLEFMVENTIMSGDDPCACAKLVMSAGCRNIGTCLDICHAQMVEHKARIESFRDGWRGPEPMSLARFYSTMASTLKWLHLSQATDCGTGLGSGKGHGAAFHKADYRDMLLLEQIIWLNKKYGFTGGLCIEVQEDDYSNAVNFTSTVLAYETALQQMLEYGKADT